MESLLGGCTAHSAFFEEFGAQVLGEVIVHIIIPIFHPLLCFIFGFYCVPPAVMGGVCVCVCVCVCVFMRSVIQMGGANFQVWYW